MNFDDFLQMVDSCWSDFLASPNLLFGVALAAKIGFVLAVLFTFAPILIWAERRQSAMMQDRIGPVRAGLQLPKAIADLAQAAHWGAFGVALASSLAVAWFVHAGVATQVESWLPVASIPNPHPDDLKFTEHHFLQLFALVVCAAVSAGAIFSVAKDPRPSKWAPLLWLGVLASYYFVAKAAAWEAVGDREAYAVLCQAGSITDLAHGDFLLRLSPLRASTFAQLAFASLLVHTFAGVALKLVVPPNGYVSVFGLLHPLADALKLVWKEDFVPPNSDKFLHAAAPIIALVPALATFAVIPFGDVFYPGSLGLSLDAQNLALAAQGPAIHLQVASINVGVLYIFAIAGTGVVGAAVAGYSSDNKFSLLGGMRAAGQMVSYEVTLGLALVPMFMLYGSLLLENMVHYQSAHRWGVLTLTGAFSFILYFTASTAESKRIPFDVPEGESELVGGYFTEYSGMKFGMFFMGEFLEVVTSSALVVTVFFGGYLVPFLDTSGIHVDVFGIEWSQPMAHWAVTLIEVLAFVVKIAVMIWFQLIIRWSLPRFRYDQIMKLCWKALLPASLANIVLTSIIVLLWP